MTPPPYYDFGRADDHRPTPDEVRATITLDDADLDALRGIDTKPTKRAPGHWRCVMWMHPAINWSRVDPLPLGNDLWLTGPRWATEEQAEQKAVEDVEKFNRLGAGYGYAEIIRYVRAEYFPEYA